MNSVKKTVIATGNELTVPLGFSPSSVYVINTSNLSELVYNETDAMNSKGVDIAATGDKTSATAGIVLFEGSQSLSNGIKIEAGSPVNVSGETIIIEASYPTESA